MLISIPSPDHLDSAARTFAAAIKQHRIIAFQGSMGAGKTTFIAALCKVLGVDDIVTSPTFAIVNEYEVTRQMLPAFPKGDIVYHFDFYRINRSEEIFDMGYEDYFYSGRLCLIEWPEILGPLLPDDALVVQLTVHTDGSRTLRWDEDKSEK